MAALVGCEAPVPLRYLINPTVSSLIRKKAREMVDSGLYSRTEHIRQLTKIRDAAMNDQKYKVALDSEIQIGKASGLYENLGDEDQTKKLPAPEELTTEQLRARLAGLDARNALPQPSLSEPEVFVPQASSDDEAF